MIVRSSIIAIALLCCINNVSFSKNLRLNSSKSVSQLWTCAMHPQIRSDKPGKCPICSMDLTPLIHSDQNNSSIPTVSLSKRARKLAEVQTSKVVRRAAFIELNLTGKIDYDETKSANIVAHFSGRVEKLFANYTGMYVEKGTHLAEIFGPDLYINQREILIAHSSLLNAEQEKVIEVKNKLLKTYNSVMSKMRVLGFTKEQIQKVIDRGTVSDTLVLYTPISGTIINKNIVQGQYFEKGQDLFIISNLNDLWLNLDAYELDLPFLKYGQKVIFEVDAVPGKKFEGKIIFIEPILNKETRTSNVRVVIDNSERVLKPGMFVKATVSVQVGEKGIIQAESLKGKWISPMHPQIIKDKPGRCDICGMKLVPAETMGFYKEGRSNSIPLLIPSSAPLITGKRAVVYVEITPGTYEARTVTLGPKVGNYYIVQSGLHDGEKVVTKGNFKIDSELQIKSTNAGMMSLFSDKKKVDDGSMNTEVKAVTSETEQTVFTAVSNFYFDVQKTLSEDDLKYAIKSIDLFSKYLHSLSQTQIKDFESKTKVEVANLLKIISNKKSNDSISEARKNFYKLSIVMAPFMRHLEHLTGKKIYGYECSMAFDNKGAYWFQDFEEIANPYFGDAMKRCGSSLIQ
jgi:membrane fusion protein, copper/silver efflux system